MKIIVVENDRNYAQLLASFLEMEGHHIDCVESAIEAFNLIRLNEYQLMTTNLA